MAVNAATFDLGNAVNPRDDIQAASGRKGYIVTGRDPAGSIDPEATALSSFDHYPDWEAGNSVAIAVGIGSASRRSGMTTRFCLSTLEETIPITFARERTFAWPVIVYRPKDGDYRVFEFTARFRRWTARSWSGSRPRSSAASRRCAST